MFNFTGQTKFNNFEILFDERTRMYCVNSTKGEVPQELDGYFQGYLALKDRILNYNRTLASKAAKKQRTRKKANA